MRQLLGVGLLSLILVAASNARAQAPDSLELLARGEKPIRLLRVRHDAVDMRIDGRLDEAEWQRVQPIGELKVIEPDTMADPPYDTELRIFYSERGIYASFDLEQPAETIIQRFTPRDAFEVSRDFVTISLDASGDGRFGYWMSMSLGDSEMDGTILPERQYGRDWDGAWYGATQRTERGWAAEFYIPWSQMAMPKRDEARRIGVYVSRSVAHRNERWGWPALPETRPRFLSLFQPLELEGVDPRQQWSVFPYVSGTMDRVVDNTRFKAGADMFWRPSTNVQLTATVNPDFGSVESDEVVINLTADETFFPEKRLFFQEGQQIFSLSDQDSRGGEQPISVVNTRRIGGRPRELSLPPGVELSERQELKPADIVTAAKATGQLGSFRYGVLAAVEDRTDYVASDSLRYTQDGRDFGALRILYEDSIGAAYRGLGWISTLVAHPEADAVVHGADFHYLTTSGRWNINGQVLYSDRDETGTGTGAIAEVTYTLRQGLNHALEATYLDDTIDVNDLGFQVRNDVRGFRYRLSWNRSGLKRIRNFRLSPFVRYQENGAGFRTRAPIGASGEITFNNLFTVSGFAGYSIATFDDRNSFGNGTFEVMARPFGDLNFETDPSKPLSLSGRFGYRGETVYGQSIESRLGLTWRPRDNLSMALEVSHNDRNGWLLHQEDQDFTAFNATQWQPQLNLEFYPSAKQQLRLTMQWVGIRATEDRFFTLPADETGLIEGPKPPGPSDDFSISQLNFQVRYRWQIAPLSDLFIVYTKADQERTDLLGFGDMFRDNWNEPLGDQLVVKLRYRIGS